MFWFRFRHEIVLQCERERRYLRASAARARAALARAPREDAAVAALRAAAAQTAASQREVQEARAARVRICIDTHGARQASETMGSVLQSGGSPGAFWV